MAGQPLSVTGKMGFKFRPNIHIQSELSYLTDVE